MNTAFAFEVTRFITGSAAALDHLTPLELSLAVAEVAIGIAMLAIPRMIERRGTSEVETQSDYDQAA